MGHLLDASRYDTDKGPAYLRHYDRFFGPLRDQPVRLLELGVRTGGSLLLWRDYFEQGLIAGLDTEPVEIDDPTGRIRIFRGRQEDRDVLDRVGRECGPFDIVVDDASHFADLTRVSFWHLFDHHLKPGGLFVLEDWGCGYWDSWPDGRHYDPMAPGSHQHGMVGFVKELVDECGMGDVTMPGRGISPSRLSKFDALHLFRGQVFVVKTHGDD
jgi:SAM-dependent methyltransferase